MVEYLRDTNKIGDICEVKVLADLVGKGYTVLQPFGDNARYDLVVDNGTKFIRIQCKSGRLRDGCVLFNTYSTHTHRGGAAKKGYAGEADVFASYCPDTDEVYYVSVDEAPTARLQLRVEPPTKCDSKIKYAKSYRNLPL